MRARGASCNTVACLAGHAAFLDPIVSGTISEEGVIIGNRIFGWDQYSIRVFGNKYTEIVEIRNWNKLLYRTEAFNRLPKYKQAAVALSLYVEKHFDYALDLPDDLKKIAYNVR